MKASPSLFTRYEFDDAERLAASSFTELQRAYIHNERAIAAEEKARLAFNAADVVATARQDGFFQGMMAAYTFLLEIDENSREVLRTLSENVRITREEVLPQQQQDLSSIFAPSQSLNS